MCAATLRSGEPENRAGLGLSRECPGFQGTPSPPTGPENLPLTPQRVLTSSTSAAWALEGRTQPAGEGTPGLRGGQGLHPGRKGAKVVPPCQPLVSRPTTPHEGAQASASSSWGPCSGQADTCAVGTLGLACAPITALQGGWGPAGLPDTVPSRGRDEASHLPGTCTC